MKIRLFDLILRLITIIVEAIAIYCKMISVKLFTDKRVWRRKYDERTVKKQIHIWDENGRFLDKEKYGQSPSGEEKLPETCSKPRASQIYGERDEGVLRSSDVSDAGTTAVKFDCNRFTQERLHVMIALRGTSYESRDETPKNEVILRKKKNHNGYIVLRTYQCAIPALLKNIVERLNDENFNAYENDDSGGYSVKMPGTKALSEWHVLTDRTWVTEEFMRNHFYILLTPRKCTLTQPTTNHLRPALTVVNMSERNTLINLSDRQRCYFDVRDDQEIHIRPVESYLPVDLVFAGEKGITGLYFGSRQSPSEENNGAAVIKMQRIDHRCVLYVAFNAINQKSDPLLIVEILNVIYRLCEGLALKNWYDYDLCLGRRQEELCHDRACLCALSSGEHLYSGWYCGIRTTLAKATQKPTSDLREWTWLNTEINQAGCFGQIDFFYWNFLFLRKRFCLYKNPFNAVKFNAKTFIETHSLRDMQGNMLDLCFDCWNFTSNLGEIVCIFNDDKKTSDKKKT